MKERWKTIHEAPAYEVSDQGRIRKGSKLMKPYYMASGYAAIKLQDNGTRLHRYIHRLVCTAFHGTPEKGKDAAHNNGERADNRASNLRWASRSENHMDKCNHGTMLRGQKHHSAKLTESQIKTIRERKAMGESIDALAEEYGVHRMTIYRAWKGINWSHIK